MEYSASLNKDSLANVWEKKLPKRVALSNGSSKLLTANFEHSFDLNGELVGNVNTENVLSANVTN